jgi:serine/threonine protein kinase
MRKISLEQHFQQTTSRTDISPEAIDIMNKMLIYDSKKRISAQECLSHPFFNEVPLVIKQMGNQR